MLHFYTPQQLNKILEVFNANSDPFARSRNKLILYLMGVERLRNIEVHRACVEDINWEVKAIMVRGKGTKGRMKPIYPCDETFTLLKEYLASIPKDKPIKKDSVLTPLILSSSHRNLMGRITRNGITYMTDYLTTTDCLTYPDYGSIRIKVNINRIPVLIVPDNYPATVTT